MPLSPITAELKANISEFSSKMGEARAELSKTGTHGESSFNKLATFGKAAFLGLATAAAGFGAVAVHEAMEGEKAHAALVNAIKNSGAAVKPVEEQVDALTQKYAKLGFTNDELEQGFARLTQITHSTSTAMKDISLAADLATTKHISLEQASTIVGKAANGNVTALGKMGVQVKDLAGKSDAGAIALGRLRESIGGAAAAQADTFAGKVKALHATISNLTEKLGNALIPYIEKTAESTVAVVNWLEKHKSVAESLAVVIGGPLVVAMGAFIAKQAESLALKTVDRLESIAAGAVKAVGAVTALGVRMAIAADSEIMLEHATAVGMVGALGGLGLAIGAAAVAIHLFTKSQDDQKKATQNATQALKEQLRTGENVPLQQAAELLGTKKMSDALRDLGVSHRQAALAIVDTSKKGDDARKALDSLRQSTQEEAASELGLQGFISKGTAERGNLIDKLEKQVKAYQSARDSEAELQKTQKDVGAAVDGSTTATATNTKSVDANKTAYEQLSQAVDAYQKKLDEQTNPILAAQDAQSKYNQDLADFAKVMEGNKKELFDHTGAFNLNSEAGRKASDAYTGVVRDAMSLSAALAKSGSISKDQQVVRENEIAQLQRYAQQYPAVRGEVQGLIDKLVLVPTQHTTDMIVNTGPAIQNVGSLEQAIINAKQLAGETITPEVRGQALRDARNLRADGGGVIAGASYIVGERHPEVFTPDVSGHISPTMPSVRQSSDVTVTNNFNIDGRGFSGDGQQLAKYIASEIAKLERSGWKAA